MSFHRVGAGLVGAIATWVEDPHARARLLDGAWRSAAGEGVADSARPIALERGRLRMALVDEAWRSVLEELQDKLLESLQAELGADVVRAIEWN